MPASAAMPKAVQVQGSISAATWLNGRALLVNPKSRRSTVMMLPTTRTNANTCTVSIVGNIHTDSRICVGKLSSCSLISHCGSDIGNPAPRGHDARPDDNRRNADDTPCAAARGGLRPIVRIAPRAALHEQQDAGKRQHQQHFHAKDPI